MADPICRLIKIDESALHVLFSDLVEVNDQGVATGRRSSFNKIRQNESEARLVDARILITDARN